VWLPARGKVARARPGYEERRRRYRQAEARGRPGTVEGDDKAAPADGCGERRGGGGLTGGSGSGSRRKALDVEVSSASSSVKEEGGCRQLRAENGGQRARWRGDEERRCRGLTRRGSGSREVPAPRRRHQAGVGGCLQWIKATGWVKR
jgi:hypothetical protein